jgi:hypothetical protein
LTIAYSHISLLLEQSLPNICRWWVERACARAPPTHTAELALSSSAFAAFPFWLFDHRLEHTAIDARNYVSCPADGFHILPLLL